MENFQLYILSKTELHCASIGKMENFQLYSLVKTELHCASIGKMENFQLYSLVKTELHCASIWLKAENLPYRILTKSVSRFSEHTQTFISGLVYELMWLKF
jgi:hypothetical protein